MRRYVSVLVVLVCVTVLASMVQAATWPNEPSGSTLITENPWLPGYFPCNYCQDSYGWRDVYNSAFIVQNPNGVTAPGSSPYVVQATYAIGQHDSGAMTIDYTDWNRRTNDVYVGFWVMFSSNFNSNGAKLFISFQSADGGSYYGSNAAIISQSGSNYILGTYFPGTVNNCHLANITPSPCTPGTVNMFGNRLPFTLGQWHRVEARYKKSTTETSQDGIVQMWLDGQLAMDYRNANFHDAPFFEWQVYPSLGRAITEPNTRVWYDDVRISAPPSTPVPDTIPPAPPMNLTAR